MPLKYEIFLLRAARVLSGYGSKKDKTVIIVFIGIATNPLSKAVSRFSLNK